MATIVDNTKRAGLSRRDLLKRGTIGAALVISGPAVLCPTNGWAVEATTLKPDAMATLIVLARDIYPHDKLADKYYAIAIKGQDALAAKDAKHKDLIEKGIADLDKRAGGTGYRGIGWEKDRLKLLYEIESTPFFQAIRGDLVVSLYNQKEIWPLFGYEGESYSKGGYINRGFNDLEWL